MLRSISVCVLAKISNINVSKLRITYQFHKPSNHFFFINLCVMPTGGGGGSDWMCWLTQPGLCELKMLTTAKVWQMTQVYNYFCYGFLMIFV